MVFKGIQNLIAVIFLQELPDTAIRILLNRRKWDTHQLLEELTNENGVDITTEFNISNPFDRKTVDYCMICLESEQQVRLTAINWCFKFFFYIFIKINPMRNSSSQRIPSVWNVVIITAKIVG